MPDYNELKEAVIEGMAADVKEMTQAFVDEGRAPKEILDNALIPAMDVVGEKFAKGEFHLPEMLIAAKAMQGGLAILRPLLTATKVESKGKVVVGTVEGDLHDIGKSLVAMMMEGAGFDVIDLGANVRAAQFVEAVAREKPDFVMMSALLTTTMPRMKTTINALDAAGLRGSVKVGVGGAPVNQGFADEIGADFFAADATLAVVKARELLGEKVSTT